MVYGLFILPWVPVPIACLGGLLVIAPSFLEEEQGWGFSAFPFLLLFWEKSPCQWLGLAGGCWAEVSTASSTQAEESGWHQADQPHFAFPLTSSPLPSPPAGFPMHTGSSHRSTLPWDWLFLPLSLAPSINDARWFKHWCFLLLTPSLSLSLSLPPPPIPTIFVTHEVKVVIILYLHGLSCLHHLLASKW